MNDLDRTRLKPQLSVIFLYNCSIGNATCTKDFGTSTEPIKPEAYLIFPSYSLPDLSFLKKHDYSWIGDALLTPQYISRRNVQESGHSQRSFHELKKQQMGHVKDWESLKILLPEEIRQQVNSVAQSGRKPRPKSCDHGVLLRQKANAPQHRT